MYLHIKGQPPLPAFQTTHRPVMFPFFSAHTFKYWVEDKYHGVRYRGFHLIR